MYIDGFPVAEVTNAQVVLPSDMEPLSPQSWIGKSRFPTDPGLNGTLDEFRIYDRVLSQTEIANLAWPQHDYSYWRFDEGSGATTIDSSDNAVPTSLLDGAGWAASGRLGAALDLSGVSATTDAGTTGPHVVFGQNPLTGCTSSLTVAAWVKIHASTNWSRIFDFGTPATGPGSRFIYLTPNDGGGIHFAMVSPSGPALDLIATGKPVPADGQWHHVAVTDANGAITIYLDGASAATGSSALVTPADFTTTDVTANWLGKSRFGDPYLNGSIDELRISCRAYTADEIKNLAHP
jgi:hypothetical protein